MSKTSSTNGVTPARIFVIQVGVVLTAMVLLADATYAQVGGFDMSKRPGVAHSKEPRSGSPSPPSMVDILMQDTAELRRLHGDGRERTFLTKMMDHHQSGIDMAKLAVQKSRNLAIRKEAQRIIHDQTQEITQMQKHLAQAHKITRTAKPDPRMQPMMQKLRGLSGAAFDQVFVENMRMHHQGAIDMAEIIVHGGVPHAKVVQLARKTIQGNKRSQRALRQALS